MLLTQNNTQRDTDLQGCSNENVPAVEVCRRWEFPWVPWESHGNGNKGAIGMGMEMGMGIS